MRSLSGYCPQTFSWGLLAVVVYNLHLWRRDRELANRLRDECSPVPALRRMPKVSALVAAWNESDRIDDHIRSFLALTYPNIELILCAGGDDTLDRARRYASERVIVLEQQPGEGKQRALARCLEHASGEIIYLTDADSLFVDEALVRLLAPLINEDEHVATGYVRPLDQQLNKLLPAYLWASDVVSSTNRPVYVEGLQGANAAITRRVLDRIGGLGFPARTGTDYQLARLLVDRGIAIRYVGTSSVPSEYPETLDAYRRMRSRWLRNLLIYGPRHGATRDVQATLKTVAVGMAMICVPLTALIFGPTMLAMWTLLVAHAAASKLRYTLFAARLYSRPVPARLLAGLLPLTLVDFVIWASPVLDLLSTKRRQQW
jgi:cellulose synthase/poly-beta-1,6-N-acetylglucosamine synthase-like glycosyltransferase